MDNNNDERLHSLEMSNVRVETRLEAISERLGETLSEITALREEVSSRAFLIVIASLSFAFLGHEALPFLVKIFVK